MATVKAKLETGTWEELPAFTPQTTAVIDSLESSDSLSALSANMGKTLNEKFDDYLLTVNHYPRQDAISVTFAEDTILSMPATSWSSIILPFDYVMANSNDNLYSLQSDGSVRVHDAGYYLICGTANSDHVGNWSLVVLSAVINDTKTNGMESCWLAPVVVHKDAGDSIALYARCETASASMRFRTQRSYLTIIRIA